ncbi:fungal-specific transcription factor domain-containing protein [Penicillium cataractarum]|uniref:Fungal-specific transcription factor domain-containing protein n=1 Tax=Penicillium cataractarum TaxID=2100454 RepID=A0A9W9VI36_9EURO|nr:fungal-specific transcription factor domain-containing protein [Penicillium cataractarum]KAJ5380245.1 fungal-specific transcription factor domain-containing protein [Penicillium cataractarum]
MTPMKKDAKRKYVTTACDACRQSKVKVGNRFPCLSMEIAARCDGAQPSCSNCQNKMKECTYRAGSDKRKISLRFVVDLLVNRLDELSQYLIDQGLSPPPMFNENEIALKNALETLGLGHVQLALEKIETKDRHLAHSSLSGTTQVLLEDTEGADLEIDLSELNSNMDILGQPLMNDGFEEIYQPRSRKALGLPRITEDSLPPLFEDEIVDLGGFSDMGQEANPKDSSPQALPALAQPIESNQQQPPSDLPDSESSDHNLNSNVTMPSSDEVKQNSNGGEDMEDIVHRLSDRMGSLQIGSDGQVRYYGPTSHFNLLRMPTPDKLTIHRNVRKDGQDYLYRMGIGKSVPPDLEAHLINLFFTWHNPSFDVVDRKMYEAAKQRWQVDMEDTPYYSEALNNAMCCLGAAFEPRYHPNFITYPKSVSDFFADRAKTLLDIELDSPCLATVQAMVVLSGHDIGCKRDARGWLYSGMAMRLAFDLGLHLDMSSYVSDGSISAAEAELRRMVFWGAYTLDQHWGFLLGRPFRINMEDVTVDKPGRDSNWDQAQRWTPYGLPYPVSPLPDPSIVNPVTALSQSRILLCEIMTPLGHVLYGSSKISKHDLQSLNAKTTKKLLQWKANLPTPLQVDLDNSTIPYLPHVLLLHMHYHQAIIHAHRPWISKSSIQPQPAQGPGHTHARKMCVESATAIAKLLHLYELRYTFRRMNIQAVAITCSAALMLIFATILNRNSNHDHETVAHLSLCFRALEEFGFSWESAKRAQSFLLHMQGLWEAKVRPYRSAKRAMPEAQDKSRAQSPQPKKSRTSPESGNGGNEISGDGSTGQDLQGKDDDLIDCDSEDFDWLWAASMGAVPAPE